MKHSLRLAFPIMVAQLGVILMSVSDNIIIGRLLGTQALAAAGISNSIALLISSLAIGGFPIVATIISRNYAAHATKELHRTFNASITIAILYSIVLTLIGAFLVYYFELLAQTPQITTLSKPFLLIITLSNIPLFFFLALKQTVDGLSLPKVAMNITFIGLAANIILNYSLISGFSFFPKLGLNGAAYSTLIVRLFMLLALALYIYKKNAIRTLLPKKIHPFFITKQTLKILKLSIPGGFQMLFEIGAFSIAVVMMGWIGENALAAHQIAMNIASTTYMTATGIAFAGGIRVGSAVGKKDINQVKIAAKASYFLVLIFMTTTMILILIFREPIIQIYISDLEILALAKPLLVIAAIFQLSDGIQAVALGNLRGISDVNIPAYITFIAYWVISLPLGYFLAFHYSLGAKGIWYALLAGLSFAAVFLTIRFINILKNPDKVIS